MVRIKGWTRTSKNRWENKDKRIVLTLNTNRNKDFYWVAALFIGDVARRVGQGNTKKQAEESAIKFMKRHSR